MKLLNLLILSTVFIVTANYCFSQVKKVSDFKNTDVVPTLEHAFDKDKNVIYSASYLYSIEKLRTKLNGPIKTEKQYKDLELVLKSSTHQNTLGSGDFTTEVKIENYRISTKARFQKSLPFDQKLFGGHGLQFKGVDVPSFEWLGEPEKAIEILYFKDNDNFTLKLPPRDAEHEIILSMTDSIPPRLLDLVVLVNNNINLGRNEQEQEKLKWKYTMTPYDIVLIPKLALNIEADFSTLHGNKFSCGDNSYEIGRATQYTAFYLNERGAEIQSEGITEVVFAEPAEDEEVTPKNMVFNKPFIVMLRKTNSTYPYFCMWVANAEHMLLSN